MAVRRDLETSYLTKVDTATWIEREAPALDPAFGVASHFDAQRATFTRRPPHHALKTAIDTFTTKGGSSTLRGNGDEFTWEDIIMRLKEAEERYRADGRGFAGIPRKIGRAVGDYASAFKSFVQLIPDADGYGTSIRGALSILLAAAAESARVRNVIMDWFADVPELLLDIKYTLDVYSDDPEVRKICIDLSLALLNTLECMIKWLTEKLFVRHLKTVLLPTDVSKSIDEFVKEVERQKKKVEGRKRYLKDKQTAITHRQVKQMRTEFPVMRQSLSDVKLDTRNTSLGVQKMVPHMEKSREELHYVRIQNDKQLAALARVEKIAEQMQQNLECQSRSQRQGQHSRYNEEEIQSDNFGLQAQNGLFGVLLPLALYAGWQQGRYESNRRRDYNDSHSFIDQQGLFHAMQVDVSALEGDLQSVMREGQRMDPLAQSGAFEVAMQPKFIDRISSGNRASLFVDVDSRSGATDRISAYSILSAALVATIRDFRPAFVLHFFCGMHTRNDDPLRGPTGIVRSLLAQLLNACAYDTSFVDSRTYVESIELHHLGQLCDALRHLVCQLERNAVLFFFIDGPGLYESMDWTQDLHQVMFHLQGLVNDPKVAAAVKLIVTNPGRSRYVTDHIALDDKIFARTQAVQSTRIDQRMAGVSFRRPNMDRSEDYCGVDLFDSDSEDTN